MPIDPPISTVGDLCDALDGVDSDLPVLVQMPGTRGARIEAVEKYEDAIVIVTGEPG